VSQESEVADKLLEALCRRVVQIRQADLSGILSYLHNPADVDSECELFDVPNKGRVRKSIATLVNRLIASNDSEGGVKSDYEPSGRPTIGDESTPHSVPVEALTGQQTPTSTSTDSPHTSQSQPTPAMSLQQQLQQAVVLKMAGGSKPLLAKKQDDDSMATVKKEMTLYEEGGSKGIYLQTAYNCLLTVPPSSVESERAFSAAGLLCSKIRSSMSDEVLDELVFLRAYYKALRKETKIKPEGQIV
jgi:hypothetical protein